MTKILDKMILNRLISIIMNFILGILKIFAPNSVNNIDVVKPKKRLFPRLKKHDEP